MTERIKVDICVIGAGAAGLSVAAGASQMGSKTVLFEPGEMGGDCLNYGCVPSKALLSAGHAAVAARGEPNKGVTGAEPTIDRAAVHDWVREVIDGIAPMDSVERYEGFGVRVIRSKAAFIDPKTVEGGGVQVEARRFVVATGSVAKLPPIPGLAETPHFTNETIFGLKETPAHLVIIGGGAIGCELGQAFRDLGSEVTIVEGFDILGRTDPELTGVLREALTASGVRIIEQARVAEVRAGADGPEVVLEAAEEGGEGEVIAGTHLLVAAGRAPTVEGIGLEKAGIEYSPAGIKVDAGLKTTNRRVYAVGDVNGAWQLTHAAGYEAGVVIKNALFRLPAKVDYTACPQVVYTTPEVAQVGATEADLRRDGVAFKVLRWPFAENDRARSEGRTGGFVKVLTTPKGKILGAGIVGPQAGELIQVWVLALSAKLKISAMASMIVPYPTFGEVSKRAAGSYFAPMLFSDRTKWIVRMLSWFG